MKNLPERFGEPRPQIPYRRKRHDPMSQAAVSLDSSDILADPAVALLKDGGLPQSQFISFALGDDQYGVDIMAVREIKGWVGITHLPKQPDYIRGVLNLRGTIVPIMDLRCRFGQGVTETSPLHIVIIVQIGGRQIGLIGDRVLDIVSVDASRIQPVPRTGRGDTTDFLAGLVTHDDIMIALIDLRNLCGVQPNPVGDDLH
jgi:purine-binding chemotaxis protein CheW